MPELIWPGKGLRQVAPASLVTDSILFPNGQGYPDAEPENRLILGDNLRVMSALLDEYEGKINLIYADPPFFTNRKYPARIGRGEDSRKPPASTIILSSSLMEPFWWLVAVEPPV